MPNHERRMPRASNCLTDSFNSVEFTTSRNERLRVIYPKNFTPITQLESARLGIITPGNATRRAAQSRT